MSEIWIWLNEVLLLLHDNRIISHPNIRARSNLWSVMCMSCSSFMLWNVAMVLHAVWLGTLLNNILHETGNIFKDNNVAQSWQSLLRNLTWKLVWYLLCINESSYQYIGLIMLLMCMWLWGSIQDCGDVSIHPSLLELTQTLKPGEG